MIWDRFEILYVMLEISLRYNIKCSSWIDTRSRLLCAVVQKPINVGGKEIQEIRGRWINI
jgi:hypothetical protein